MAQGHDTDTLMPLFLDALWPYGLGTSRDNDIIHLDHVIYERLLRKLSTALPSWSSEVGYP
jgi:hypothetical protein